MRITGGQFRGRTLKTVKGLRVRPTSEKVRKALFDILGDRVRGSCVLDLFAGSGALGLEALSRGAAGAVFVECWPPALAAIIGNIRALGLESKARIFKQDCAKALGRLGRARRRFDLVLADPPYHFQERVNRGGLNPQEKVLFLLDRYDILQKSGIVVLEHFAKSPLTAFSPWQRFQRAQYGQTCLSFFAKISPSGESARITERL